MCNCVNVEMGSYANTVTMPIPLHMGAYRRARVDDGLSDEICIDRCILPEVQQLWLAGVITYGSCCGHNQVEPMVNVAEESVGAMLAMGYVMNHADPARRDTFRLKSVQWPPEAFSQSDPQGVLLAGRILQSACYRASFDAGWWLSKDGGHERDDPKTFSQKLMLAVSELSEAMEGDRKGLMDTHLTHREMREVELADALIRIFDLAGAYGFDVGAAVVEKMAYNAKRADHKAEVRNRANGKRY